MYTNFVGRDYRKVKDAYVNYNALLNFNNLDIESLPNNLPTDLRVLWCSDTKITYISNLPESLQTLECRNNFRLAVIADLPKNLRELNCGNSSLCSLGPLPASLRTLKCELTNISLIKDLPPYLEYLNCACCPISDLGDLPESLKFLDISETHISYINKLPCSLNKFICNGTLLQNLPALPENLEELNIYNSQIKSLPNMPNHLKKIVCSHDFMLQNIEEIHESITEITCLCTMKAYETCPCFDCFNYRSPRPEKLSEKYKNWRNLFG